MLNAAKVHRQVEAEGCEAGAGFAVVSTTELALANPGLTAQLGELYKWFVEEGAQARESVSVGDLVLPAPVGIAGKQLRFDRLPANRASAHEPTLKSYAVGGPGDLALLCAGGVMASRLDTPSFQDWDVCVCQPCFEIFQRLRYDLAGACQGMQCRLHSDCSSRGSKCSRAIVAFIRPRGCVL
jgi:hypothetical protein